MAEQKEEMLLTMLEQAGAALRRMKAEIRQMCSENEYVKGSTIIELCDKIENKQREFAKLENAF